MEKHTGKSSSFIGRHRWRATLDSPRSTFSPKLYHKSTLQLPPDHDIPPDHDHNSYSIPDDVDYDQLLLQIDRFIDELSTAEDKTTLPDIPHHLDTFCKIIKSKTRKSTRSGSAPRNGEMITDQGTFLYESVKRLWKLKTILAPNTPLLDKITKLLHRAMLFMEEELRSLIIIEPRPPPEPKLKVMSLRYSSFNTDRSCSLSEPPTKDDDFPGFSEEKTMRINKIVTTMISVGYKNECSNIYSMGRGNALYDQLKKLDFEKLNAEDVQKLNWDWLEADVSRWIRIIKHCSCVLIPAERLLGEKIFSEHLYVFRGLFSNLIRSVVTSLLDYAAAVAIRKRSAERLFKFLDMHEALNGLREATNDSSDETKDEQSCNDLNAEISSVIDRIGEGVVNMFGDLENSIRNDVAKTPVPGGAVHPLTRYVLNYVTCACEYGDTLEPIFQQNAKLNQATSPEEMEKSPMAAQIMSVMSVLDDNLAVKSTLYKDPSLRYIFLMNNGRYILQKVKGSSEVKKVMGDDWCRRRSSEVRHYHKSYQRETWTRVLQCISQEGIQVKGKVDKKVLKERLKNLNAMLDEIGKTQSTWVVSEEQLLSELRASISGVVIPAYRSFVGRYKHHLEGGVKSIDKYIKYQPEDIETLIESLFEGNLTSMSRRRFYS
ncbi:exocyst complex component EXO70B1-like [Cynara cardunculus var. scolymus]|uniref:Exocyst subunit Exo70 family protein n=1 Tax=Cynara cardunculus var. scolymus TaxID=59895 RepID=A0A103XVY7_CYNCS|nr:exocyst complex component EXO70B1-like [Cynara cardunculus var. scolymus]KVH97873.1 hypothetical protein Ccrd_000013 [Cynara cardunculus var. scolymus]